MSMFDWEPAEEFNEGGEFLEKPGTYHVVIRDVKTTDKDGKLLDGFRIDCAVVDGTVRDANGCTEKDKKFSIFGNNGKMSDKDNGRFNRQKQAAIFVASGLIESAAHVEEIKKTRKLDIEKMRNGQLVVTMDSRTYKDKSGNDKTVLDMKGMQIYHVDDPVAAPFPKNQKVIDLLPKAKRRTAQQLQAIKEAFGSGQEKPNGSSHSSNSTTQQMTEDL